MKLTPISMINTVRELEIDHEPLGWPAVRMEFLSAMADEIQSSQIELATEKSKVEELREDFNRLAKQSAAMAKELNQELAGEKIRAKMQVRLVTDLEMRLARWEKKN